MRTIKLTIEYDGTNYCGWQAQRHGVSIQALVRGAIATMTGEEISLVGASRTDAGVHALGQVAHFKTRTSIPCDGFVRGINSMLPWDIRILDARDEHPGFHAINDARAKTYRYVIVAEPVASALNRYRSWHIRPPINAAAMQRAAAHLTGTHDFAAFKASGSQVRHAVRTITDLTVRRVRQGRCGSQLVPCTATGIAVEVTGDGFVRHMIRNIVGTLVDIGIGRVSEEALPCILESRSRKKAGVCAPASGLYLVRVWY